MQGSPKFKRNRIAGKQSMEECLPNLLVRILIVQDRVIERAEEFLATLLMPASIRQFFHESAYCIIVSDRELMRVTSHDRTSLLGNCTAQASSSQGGTELKSGVSPGWLKPNAM
jgi:hypothetical protein